MVELPDPSLDAGPGLRLIEVLSAVSRETARAPVAEMDASTAAGVSQLSYDSLVTCQRLQLLYGVLTPFPSELDSSVLKQLERAAREVVDQLGASTAPDVQLALAGVARVVTGVRRYVQRP